MPMILDDYGTREKITGNQWEAGSRGDLRHRSPGSCCPPRHIKSA
ncbi:hypothetical protein [uncultured Acidaminococcus sp.]|nr:hypothetical protein [uncultured Acidaminococcus sp.]